VLGLCWLGQLEISQLAVRAAAQTVVAPMQKLSGCGSLLLSLLLLLLLLGFMDLCTYWTAIGRSDQ
jgi:hypothetical protein